MAVALLEGVVRGGEQRGVAPVVEAPIRVVDARVATPLPGRVVRRRALRDDRETAAADGMVLQELLEDGLPLDVACRKLQAEDEHPVEAVARLLGREIDREPHARLHGAVEVDQPLQLVRDEELASVRMNSLGRIRRRVGADIERERDDAAHRLEHLDAVGVAEDDEALGKPLHLRGLRPGARRRGRIRRELGALAGRRPVDEIGGLVRVDEPARPARAVRDREAPPRGALVGLGAAGAPEVIPVALRVGQLERGRHRLVGVDRAVVGIDADQQLQPRDPVRAAVGEPCLQAHGEERERRPVAQPRGVRPRVGEDDEALERSSLRVLRSLRPGLRRPRLRLRPLGELVETVALLDGRPIVRSEAPREATAIGVDRPLPLESERGGGLRLDAGRAHPRKLGLARLEVRHHGAGATSISPACTATITGARKSR